MGVKAPRFQRNPSNPGMPAEACAGNWSWQSARRLGACRGDVDGLGGQVGVQSWDLQSIIAEESSKFLAWRFGVVTAHFLVNA